ncbi:MAG TPA: hypothetical protein VLI04_14815 [Nocardioidaceae bacterium]|nr:hypothetical protein [Nocardioidaceae bacterium]
MKVKCEFTVEVDPARWDATMRPGALGNRRMTVAEVRQDVKDSVAVIGQEFINGQSLSGNIDPDEVDHESMHW